MAFINVIKSIVIVMICFIATSCEKKTTYDIYSDSYSETSLPPLPVFEEYVDYVSWVNQKLSAGLDEEQINIFERNSILEKYRMPPGDIRDKLEKACLKAWSKNNEPVLYKYLLRNESYIQEFKKVIEANDDYAVNFIIYDEGYYYRPGNAKCLTYTRLPDLARSYYCALMILANASEERNFSNTEILLEAWRIVLKYCYLSEKTGEKKCILKAYSLREIVYQYGDYFVENVEMGVITETFYHEMMSLHEEYPTGPTDFTLLIEIECALAYDFLQCMYYQNRIDENFLRFASVDAKDISKLKIRPQDIMLSTSEYYLKWYNVAQKHNSNIDQADYVEIPKLINKYPRSVKDILIGYMTEIINRKHLVQ